MVFSEIYDSENCDDEFNIDDGVNIRSYLICEYGHSPEWEDVLAFTMPGNYPN
jgi:hypothetical protein